MFINSRVIFTLSLYIAKKRALCAVPNISNIFNAEYSESVYVYRPTAIAPCSLVKKYINDNCKKIIDTPPNTDGDAVLIISKYFINFIVEFYDISILPVD